MCTCTVCYTPSSELSSQAIDTMSHPDVVNMIIQFITLPVLPYNVKSISGVCVCVCVVCVCTYSHHTLSKYMYMVFCLLVPAQNTNL